MLARRSIAARRWAVLAALVALVSATPARADAEFAWKSYCGHAYERALKELRPLAEQGDAKAQYYLASVYLDGSAVPRSAATAVGLLERSAGQGYAPAQFTLGLLLWNGSGTGADALAPDRARALPWLARAADAGEPLAAELVGTAYAEGRVVPRDGARAANYLRVAAMAGLIDAQAALGALLGAEYGLGNAMEAYKWLLLASRAHHPGAAENLAAMRDRLNPAERQAAIASADRFVPVAPVAGACTGF